MTSTSKAAASSGYETCRTCGEPKPCACPRGGKPTTVASWRGRQNGPRLRVWDWVEFTLVSAAVWVAVVRPPIPGLDGGGCTGAAA